MSRWTPGLENALRSIGYTVEANADALTPCYLTEFRERTEPVAWIYEDQQGFHVAIANKFAPLLVDSSAAPPRAMQTPQGVTFASTAPTLNRLYDVLRRLAEDVKHRHAATRAAAPPSAMVAGPNASVGQSPAASPSRPLHADDSHQVPRLVPADTAALEDAIESVVSHGTPAIGEVIEVLAKVRKGQAAFRAALMDYWDGACAVTGLTTPALLRASHSKPWADSDASEKVDKYNGLLLAAHLDAAFDSGFIGFADDGHILISSRLSQSDATLLGFHAAMRLRRIESEHLQFLTYHRSRILLP